MMNIRLVLIIVLTMAYQSVIVDPGLSSLEGLPYIFLVVVIVFIIIAIFVGYLLRKVYLLTRKGNDYKSKRKGIAIFSILGLISFIIIQPFKDNHTTHKESHKKVASRLVKEQGIKLHVCGNFAAGNGVNKNDFVDFIDVADKS